MRAESVLRTVSSAIGARPDGVFALNVPLDLNHSQPSVASASERIEHLVRRAMLFLESDREAARRCLNDASALLGSEVQDSRTSATLPNHDILPGGLARWQAKRVLAYIEVNLGSKMGAVELADLVAFSASHFSRAFKRSLGLSPMAYVASRRVERAKMTMMSTRQQLSEIALACGFADQAHLNRSFRRWVGVSPGQWRRVNAEMVKSIPPLRD